MMMFSPSDDQKVEIYGVAAQMDQAGLPRPFVAAVVRLAEQSEGAYDLVALWRDTDDPTERDEILSDLQELIDEHEERPSGVQEKPYIHFKELKTVADKVAAFKQDLRRRVDAWGGISKLARETGIPQPSLSRFFNSASMPRRTTLYKIAHAVGLSEAEIVTDWIR